MLGHFKHEYTYKVVIYVVKCHDVQCFKHWWSVLIIRCRDRYPGNFLLKFNKHIFIRGQGSAPQFNTIH